MAARSCSCPRWRPPFVSALAPEDRCHLNGLGMIEGQPRYVTALGETDTPGGWRANKARGGLLIDIETGALKGGLDELALVGIRTRGVPLARRRAWARRCWRRTGHPR